MSENHRENREDITALWRDYENGLAYQAQSGLAKNLPEYVRFYEGKQWPAPTKATKNLPRPVVNIIKMICRNKKASIVSAKVRHSFDTAREGVDVEGFNRFSDYICREIGQEACDKEGVDDAVKKGTYVFHYYWDSEARGMLGTAQGGMRVERIDPLSIFFADPTERDEQKQRWIMISSRQDVASVRAKADRDVDPESIVSDKADEADRYGTVEQDGDELCTVLTRYFRRGGEVYCEKATKSVVVNKPFPITPDLEGAMKRLESEAMPSPSRSATPPPEGEAIKIDAMREDPPNNDLTDAASDEPSRLMPRRARAVLYPVVVGNYEARQGSIFGLGEVEGLIPNQKAINFNLAMLLLNSQQMAWGKYLVHKDALKGQVINNEPGQVLIDHTGTGQGIRKMNETGMPQQPLQIVDMMTQLSRSVTGSSEVMTGESIGANMSGAAIAQLQSQAQIPIEDLRDNFHKVKIKQGRVLAQFYKLFYRDAEYVFEDTVKNPDGTSTTKKRLGRFNGSDFADVDFEVTCEVVSGTRFSSAGDINVLDVLFAKGAISLRTYIECYPDDALSNKSKLLEAIDAAETSQVQQMTAQVQQLTQQIAQSAALLEQQKDTVDKAVSAIQENSRLRALITQIYYEADMKIRQGNEQINEITQDAADFAATLDNVFHDEELFGGGATSVPVAESVSA